MIYSAIAAPVLLLLFSAPLALALPRPDFATNDACADVHIITARGSTELQTSPTISKQDGGEVINDPNTSIGLNSTGGEGEMGLVAKRIQEALKQKTVSREAVVYPAVDHELVTYALSVSAGVLNLKEQVEKQVARCPGQKLVLLGYSQGAQVVGDALAGGGGGLFGLLLPPLVDPKKYSEKIAAVIFWGNPRHATSESFVTGTPPPTEGGYFDRPAPSVKTLEKNYRDKIKSFCNFQDKYCASGLLGIHQETKDEKSENIHIYSYLQNTVEPAVEFVASKVIGVNREG